MEKNQKKNLYEAPQQDWWQGRNDGHNVNQLRWWQNIELVSIKEKPQDFENAPVLLGFACDEGVARNKGRIGSVDAPLKLRKTLGNLPIHKSSVSFFDAGTIHCLSSNLEKAQIALAETVEGILSNNGFPILLGGGHEILYGHFLGTSAFHKNKSIGIINFDAHFDIRKPGPNGASSGTGFYQVAKDCKNEDKDFKYLALGIQESGNTAELFERVKALKAEYVLAQDFHNVNFEKIKNQVQDFVAGVDLVCLTIDLDVFSSAIAPGVSAPSAAGIFYTYTCKEILKLLAQNKKVVSLDIAEYNPKYDIDSHTAKLAAQILFDWINWRF